MGKERVLAHRVCKEECSEPVGGRSAPAALQTAGCAVQC